MEKKNKILDQIGSDDDNMFENENQDNLYQIQDGADLITSEVISPIFSHTNLIFLRIRRSS